MTIDNHGGHYFDRNLVTSGRTGADEFRWNRQSIQVEHELLVAMGVHEVSGVGDECKIDMDGFVQKS
jgi:hypothetical protein